MESLPAGQRDIRWRGGDVGTPTMAATRWISWSCPTEVTGG